MRDPTLLGTPSQGDASCCESNFGVDVELVVRSCGFDRYLGESEELACVHRFADADSLEHELRVTPIHDLGLEAASALHTSSGSEQLHAPDPAWPNTSGTWLASSATRHWVLVEGWPVLRRLSWADSACEPAQMLPVIEAMATAPASAQTIPLPRLAFDPVDDPDPASLLALHTQTTPPLGPHPLPHHASSLGETLLHAAASRDLDSFVAQFETDARWGLPDRRQLSGRSLTHDPAAALEALRSSAARLPATAKLHCPALDRRTVPAVKRGEALMWCLWSSPNQLDLIVIGLRGRMEEDRGDARVAYLGVFPRAPLAPVALPGEPPPPPAVPRPTIICGDPHAIEYPGVCPIEELVEVEEGEDSEDSEADEPEDPEIAKPEDSEPSLEAEGPPRRPHRGETLQLPTLDPV